jgi:hypothetical protein
MVRSTTAESKRGCGSVCALRAAYDSPPRSLLTGGGVHCAVWLATRGKVMV